MTRRKVLEKWKGKIRIIQESMKESPENEAEKLYNEIAEIMADTLREVIEDVRQMNR